MKKFFLLINITFIISLFAMMSFKDIQQIIEIDGKSLYKAANCASCHGRKGKSMLNIAPSLRNPTLSLEQRIEVITNGSKNDPTMIAFSPKYSKAEIKAIAEYTMTFIK